jgi:hypothetical protein
MSLGSISYRSYRRICIRIHDGPLIESLPQHLSLDLAVGAPGRTEPPPFAKFALGNFVALVIHPCHCQRPRSRSSFQWKGTKCSEARHRGWRKSGPSRCTDRGVDRSRSVHLEGPNLLHSRSLPSETSSPSSFTLVVVPSSGRGRSVQRPGIEDGGNPVLPGAPTGIGLLRGRAVTASGVDRSRSVHLEGPNLLHSRSLPSETSRAFD